MGTCSVANLINLNLFNFFGLPIFFSFLHYFQQVIAPPTPPITAPIAPVPNAYGPKKAVPPAVAKYPSPAPTAIPAAQVPTLLHQMNLSLYQC